MRRSQRPWSVRLHVRFALPRSTDIVSSPRQPLCPDLHTATKTCLIVYFRTDSSIRFILIGYIGYQSNVLIRVGADEWIVLLLPMFRATSTSNGVSNALSIILNEAISKARFPHSSTIWMPVPIVSCRTTWQSLVLC